MSFLLKSVLSKEALAEEMAAGRPRHRLPTNVNNYKDIHQPKQLYERLGVHFRNFSNTVEQKA